METEDGNTAESKAWQKKDTTAKLLVMSTLEPSQQQSLITCTTAAEMWSRLIGQHELAAAENEHFLLRNFFNYEYQEGHDVKGHVTAIELMAIKLKEAPLSDEQVITKIISTLPPSFNMFAASWENLDDSKKTLNPLGTRLTKPKL